MTAGKSLNWEAYFWVGGCGRARPGHLGLLELQNSESQSRFCDLYVSPYWEVGIFIKIYGAKSNRDPHSCPHPSSKFKCDVSNYIKLDNSGIF